MKTTYKLSDEWKAKAASMVHVQLPRSRISMMPYVPRRFSVQLCEATQEQLMILHQLHHPAVIEVRPEVKPEERKKDIEKGR